MYVYNILPYKMRNLTINLILNFRAKIKSECRSIVLDSFIEKMVDSMDASVKEKRKQTLVERQSKLIYIYYYLLHSFQKAYCTYVLVTDTQPIAHKPLN